MHLGLDLVTKLRCGEKATLGVTPQGPCFSPTGNLGMGSLSPSLSYRGLLLSALSSAHPWYHSARLESSDVRALIYHTDGGLYPSGL